MRYGTWLGLAVLACGCGRDAERLSQAGKIASAKIESATGGVRAKVVNGVQAARGETGLDSRVATRLHWDKAMLDAAVRVTSPEPGMIQLDGTVVSDEQQRRAVELATTTIGVEKVESKLTVAEKP